MHSMNWSELVALVPQPGCSRDGNLRPEAKSRLVILLGLIYYLPITGHSTPNDKKTELAESKIDEKSSHVLT
jgi:hypothetical protein